ERVPAAPARSRDEALAELARRYLRSRGPATPRDFGWWSSLGATEARKGLDLVRAEDDPPLGKSAARAHLLPAFDEYLVGYTDRSAVLDPAHTKRINAGGGLLAPVVLIDGRVAGVWKRTFDKETVVLTPMPLRPWSPSDKKAIAAAGERYGAFL